MSMDRPPYLKLDLHPEFPNSCVAAAPVVPTWRYRLVRAARAITRSLAFHLALLGLTILTTLVAGTHIALNYSRGSPALDLDLSGAFFQQLWRHPAGLLSGVPFSFALLAILLAHEMGHYLTCRYYRLEATYPYFIPAPTLIGTMGAFIRIRSLIPTREALFDVGVAGPLAGFVLAIPTLVWGILDARVIGALPSTENSFMLGSPLALTLFARLLRPEIAPARLLLGPVGCAACVGLLATALNLLPIGQLDGGHILYAVFGKRHKLFSLMALLSLVPLGIFCWQGWLVWAGVLLLLGLRHPSLMDPYGQLGRGRKALAVTAIVMLVFSFVPTPTVVR